MASMHLTCHKPRTPARPADSRLYPVNVMAVDLQQCVSGQQCRKGVTGVAGAAVWLGAQAQAAAGVL